MIHHIEANLEGTVACRDNGCANEAHIESAFGKARLVFVIRISAGAGGDDYGRFVVHTDGKRELVAPLVFSGHFLVAAANLDGPCAGRAELVGHVRLGRVAHDGVPAVAVAAVRIVVEVPLRLEGGEIALSGLVDSSPERAVDIERQRHGELSAGSYGSAAVLDLAHNRLHIGRRDR